MNSTTIDCAGAVGGGSARFLRELKSYLAVEHKSDVFLIGDSRQLTPSWLIQREVLAARSQLRISLNNAGFCNPRGRNVTLLANILQFASPEEMANLNFRPPRRLRAQTPLVRLLASASDTLIVPCTRMAEQVSSVAPHLADKLTVRFHPVARPIWAGQAPTHPRDVLVPIVPQPYKQLDRHLPEFLAATESIPGDPIRLIIPAERSELPALAGHHRVDFIGRKTAVEMDEWWQRCGAIFFPVEFEAFGYALAESRVYGRHVIAQDITQNREIAAAALSPYTRGGIESLRVAIEKAIDSCPVPDSDPFDPHKYFDWLVRVPSANH